MRQSIPKSLIVRARDLDEAMAFSNDYAPEHLILHLQQAPEVVAKVENAGSVFVGPYTPERCFFLFSFIHLCSFVLVIAAVIMLQERTTRCLRTGTRGSLAGSIHYRSRSTLPRSRSRRRVLTSLDPSSQPSLIARDWTPMQTP